MGLYDSNIEVLEEAKAEALRFAKKADEAIAVLQSANVERCGFSGSKETAAAKRASMDLTRALVCVRK